VGQWSIHLAPAIHLAALQLKAHYQAVATEQLPPRLVALLKRLDEETEPSAEHVEVI